MAKDRFVGRGAELLVQSGNTFTSVGQCRSITPPARERAIIDLTAMDDTTFVGDVGIEGESTVSIDLLTDPVDAAESALDTLYANFNATNFKITCKSGAKVWSKVFPGKVVGLTPAAFGGSDPVARTVKILRTGAITDTVA